MDTLHYVERDENKFYCFIEVCQTLFPDTPKSTVRNWIKTLNISTVTCQAEERTIFKARNASLAGTFGLIEHDSLVRLINHRGVKRPAVSSESSTTCSASTSANPEPNADTSTPKPCRVDEENVIEPKRRRVVTYSDSSDGENSTDQPCTSITNSSKSSCKLSMSEAPEQLQKEVKNLRSFYRKDLNPNRRGSKLSTVTIEKLTERVMCFMFYCKNIESRTDLSLTLFNNVELYTRYLEYLKDTRKLKPSTLVAHIIVSINVVKYNFAIFQPATNASQSREVLAYQAFQRQFQKESLILAKSAKEGLLTSKASRQFYFAHILETLRSIRDKYYETNGLQKSRHLHDFVLLATYLRAIPGRSKEMRTMKLYVESEQNEPFDYSSVNSGNYIVFELENKVFIVQFDFKTSKTFGPTKTDLSDDEDLIYFLKLYLSARPSLLLGKSHDFFFCNRNGTPFQCSSSIAKYLGDIFEREVKIRASTNALRHAIITYFTSLDEASDSEMRKSLALLMKTSVRYQESVYTDLSHFEQTRKGRDLMRTKIASDVFGREAEDSEIVLSSDESDISDSADEIDLKPVVGDVVALVDPIATEENVEFFLAKIARFTNDRKEAHLIHLERAEDSDNLYRLKPGKAWTESSRALIFPIDIVYNPSSKAYELRTSPQDIFNCVRGRGKMN